MNVPRRRARLLIALALVACRAPADTVRDAGPQAPRDESSSAIPAAKPATVSRKLPNPVAYIPPQCYTRTAALKAEREGRARHNPCYVCHARAEPPNFVEDADSSQLLLSLPAAARENPWTNLFSPPIARAAPATDDQVLAYVRTSNYFDDAGRIALAARLQPPPTAWDLDRDGRWGGWVPDV